MTTLPVTATDIGRVRYSEGQYLTAADFRTDQDYHRQAVARHQLGGHTYGLLVGLELVETPDPGDATLVDVHLSPGLAIDGYGRQLVSFSRVALDASLFEAFIDDAHHEVWIAFDETAAREAGPGWADCGDGAPTRTMESIRIVIDPLDDVTDVVVEGVVAATPPAPAGTPEIPADRSVPYQELPVEPPLARWLVRAGDVRWDGVALRFRPAAAQRLTNGRRYAGAVAAEVLTPSSTLRVAQRREPPDLDAADFATVEGRLRVRGRVNAERELWMEGHPIRFTLAAGAEAAEKAMTLVRTDDATLRLDLGDKLTSATELQVGTKQGTSLVVGADGRARLPIGPLQIGPDAAMQEIELHSTAYGVGTQRGATDGTLYLRSAKQFAWYTGGGHKAAPLDPGTGGVRRLVLDAEGTLDFGAVTHQMIKLWSSGPTDGGYGIGVQNATLYFRSHYDIAWYRNGVHNDNRGNAGGGTVQMRLTEDATLQVTGAATTGSHLTVGTGGDAVVITRHVRGKQSGADGIDNLYLNWGVARDVVVGGGGTTSALDVSGALRVRGPGKTAVQSVIKVVKRESVVLSGPANSPGQWEVWYAGELDEVLEVFVVVAGFGLTPTAFNTAPPHHPSTSNIPQYVWARCDGSDPNHAWGRAMCSESDPTVSGDNHIAITVIAMGRKYL